METFKDVEQYWKKKEQELGEPILRKSISHTYLQELPDTFGILFASAKTLVYEYSKGGRRSILDVVLSRKTDDELSDTVRIPRDEIQKVALVDAFAAKQWVRRALSPAAVLTELEGRTPSVLRSLFFGTHLVVCSRRAFVVCDTPENRKWLEFLEGH